MIVLQGADVLTPDGELRTGNISVADDLIAEVDFAPRDRDQKATDPTSKVIDCTGLTVLPGFVDAHAHLGWPPLTDPLRSAPAISFEAVHIGLRALQMGVTTLRDLGDANRTMTTYARFAAQGKIPGPSVISAGTVIVSTGGHSADLGHLADGPDQVRIAARAQLDAGAEWLKVMCSGGSAVGDSPDTVDYTPRELEALTEEARRTDTPIAAHAHPAAAIRMALEAGARSIEHGSFLDRETAEYMAGTGAFLVPTFAVYEHVSHNGHPEQRDLAKRIVSRKLESFGIAREAGIPWAVGSDGGSREPIELFQKELDFLVRHIGLSPAEVIMAATRGNAELLGKTDRGVIEKGKRADLAIVGGDPLHNIDDAKDVRYTMAAGRLHDWSLSRITVR